MTKVICLVYGPHWKRYGLGCMIKVQRLHWPWSWGHITCPGYKIGGGENNGLYGPWSWVPNGFSQKSMSSLEIPTILYKIIINPGLSTDFVGKILLCVIFQFPDNVYFGTITSLVVHNNCFIILWTYNLASIPLGQLWKKGSFYKHH